MAKKNSTAEQPLETPQQAAVEPAEQTEAEWWAEDAARYNAIGEHFQAAGELVGTAVKPKKLNPDGSLAAE